VADQASTKKGLKREDRFGGFNRFSGSFVLALTRRFAAQHRKFFLLLTTKKSWAGGGAHALAPARNDPPNPFHPPNHFTNLLWFRSSAVP
jgi:hypothetical protein